MFSLDILCAQETKDVMVAELWEEGSAGIVELSETRLRAFFEDDARRVELSARFEAAAETAIDEDWVAAGRENIEPMLVGEKFFLVPEWRDDPAPEGRSRITVNNGLAFGTGRHETTRLCLELLERYVRPGATVVDIGTGSGILAKGAQLLEAGVVIACDVDPLAVEVARANGVDVFLGSADAVRDAGADLVIANISPEWLIALKDEWMRMLKPGGHAILSGVELSDELPFAPVETRVEGNWKALVLMAGAASAKMKL
jgi:ribosomal protein L11 methyltransferase